MEHFIEFGAQLTGNIISQGNTPDLAARGNSKSMITEQAQGIIPIFGGLPSLAGNKGDSMKSRIFKTAAGGVIGRGTVSDIEKGRAITKAIASKLSSKKGDKDSDGGDKGGR